MDNQEKKMPWQKETIDEFIEKAGQKKSRLVSFTSAWKCNLCSCKQYKGGSGTSDLCENCGHRKDKHEWRS